MDDKIIKIPISYDERKKNEKGEGYVPCQISERYLEFSMESALVSDGEFICVDVMTENSSTGVDKLLAGLTVKKADILRIVESISPVEKG